MSTNGLPRLNRVPGNAVRLTRDGVRHRLTLTKRTHTMDNGRRILVTDENFHRLSRVIENHGEARAMDLLEQELARAEIVSSTGIPSDVVTMNTRLQFEEIATNATREIELVYPDDADWQKGRISVVAPVGVALLGLSVGDTFEFAMPAGLRRLRVVSVIFQPEAAALHLPPAA